MVASELAKTIVQHYAASCRRNRDEGTQTALDLTRLEDLVRAVDALAGVLLASLRRPGMRSAIEEGRRGSVMFFEGQYLDLHSFCAYLHNLVTERAVRAACARVVQIIEGRGAPSPVLEHASVGRRLRSARGLSIYFPPGAGPFAGYRDLAFTRQTRWAELLIARGR
jgi:hypothetical protein